MSKHSNDILLLKKYINGELDARAMHELERRALDDPFLADAIEGYEHAQRDQQSNFADLSQRLKSRTERKVVRIVPWIQFSAAASLLTIIGAGIWLMNRSQPEKQTKLANEIENKAPQKPQASTPAPVSASPTTSTDTLKKAAIAKNRTASSNNPPTVADLRTPVIAQAEVKEKAAVKRDTITALKPVTNPPITFEDKAYAQPTNKPTGSVNAMVVDANKNKLKEVPVRKAPVTNPETLLTSRVEGVNVTPANKTLTGIVTGLDGGQPLAGAIVKLAGSDFGAVTDAHGRFILHNVPEKKNLEVGYIGYATKQVKVNGSDSINISLQPNVNSLNEVVTTAPADKTSNEAHPSTGWKAYNDYLNKNAASPDGATGKVRVTFTVDGQGNLSSFKITKSLSQVADQKAIDLVTNGPGWAGNVDGKPHEVKLTIQFK